MTYTVILHRCCSFIVQFLAYFIVCQGKNSSRFPQYISILMMKPDICVFSGNEDVEKLDAQDREV